MKLLRRAIKRAGGVKYLARLIPGRYGEGVTERAVRHWLSRERRMDAHTTAWLEEYVGRSRPRG